MNDDPIKIAVNRMQLSGKLPQGDGRWATFNDSFVCQEIPLLDIANNIYTGHAYAGWHNGRRCTENFLCAQHIGVDMDSGDTRSTFDELLQHDFFKTYGGLIHTTPSHTPQTPRARLLFFLDEPITNPTAFQAAAKFVVSLFPGADSAVTDASRFFYGCSNCSIEIPFKTLPLSHLRHYYARVTAQTRVLTQPVQRPTAKTSDTQSTGTQNKTTEIERVEQALKAIDPWQIDYSRWIGIIAALKRECGSSGLSLAVNWAKGQPGEVEREWERLHVDRTNAMGLGTIFGLASGKVH